MTKIRNLSKTVVRKCAVQGPELRLGYRPQILPLDCPLRRNSLLFPKPSRSNCLLTITQESPRLNPIYHINLLEGHCAYLMCTPFNSFN